MATREEYEKWAQMNTIAALQALHFGSLVSARDQLERAIDCVRYAIEKMMEGADEETKG